MPPSRSGPSDTDPRVAAMVVAAHREMSAREKMARVLACNAASEAMVAAGVRARRPELSPEQVKLHVAALRLGRQVMIDAFGRDPESSTEECGTPGGRGSHPPGPA